MPRSCNSETSAAEPMTRARRHGGLPRVRDARYSPAFVSVRQHTAAYGSIRQHTSAYASIRQHTSAYARVFDTRYSPAAQYVSIRQHTSAYVSIRQHTSAYVSIRQHTSAHARVRDKRHSPAAQPEVTISAALTDANPSADSFAATAPRVRAL
jgi:hypothetical protein